MKIFHGSWNAPETVFYEMLWKKNFTVYPSLTDFFKSKKKDLSINSEESGESSKKKREGSLNDSSVSED